MDFMRRLSTFRLWMPSSSMTEVSSLSSSLASSIFSLKDREIYAVFCFIVVSLILIRFIIFAPYNKVLPLGCGNKKSP